MAMQARETGKVTATGAAAGDKTDNTLPDPSTTAKWWLFALAVSSVLVAIVLSKTSVTPAKNQLFDSSAENVANFALFAGFYVAAQVIAAALTVIGPFVPPWKPPAELTDPAAKAAQTKADRSALLLGLAALGGVVLSCTLGLYFLEAVGLHASHTVDAIFTGATLAGGAKPLHDFIGLVQNKSAPNTGTGDGT
jgi:hypothetical protein